MNAILQSRTSRKGPLLFTLILGLPLLAGGKTPKPASAAAPATLREVIVFENAVWQIAFKANCDLAYLKRVSGPDAGQLPEQQFITENLEALCKPGVKLKPGSYAGKPAEIFRLEMTGRCEPRAIRRLDGTPEALNAFAMEFNQKCEMLSFSRKAAASAPPR